MKELKTKKTWQKTRIQNLVRHKSGNYYARAFDGGKEIWKSLKTSHFGVAEAKLAEFLKEHRERRGIAKALSAGKMAFKDALKARIENIAADVRARRTKPGTERYWKQIFAALLKSWPALAERDIRRITATECKA